jgi:enamine deaminase RidA (YjgF/YER057c/UK114 family)
MSVYDVISGPRPWPPYYTFSPAVRTGDFLFLSGMTATDEDMKIIAPGDIVGQTRYIFQRMEAVLKSVGASCENIVSTTEYLTTTENYKGTAAVRREFFKGRYPAATGVIVSGLLREGALIEISAIAVLPDA